MSEIGKQKMAWQKDELAAMHHEPHVAAFVAHGRLHSPLGRWVLIGFVSAFFLLMVLPGVWQIWTERKESAGVQILHLLRDMTITPGERASELGTGVDTLCAVMARPGWKDSGEVAWDNAIQAMVPLWQRAKIVNRHVELDSLDSRMQPWSNARLAFENHDISKVQTALGLLKNHPDVFSGFVPSAKRLLQSWVRENLLSRQYLRAWESGTEESTQLAQWSRPLLQNARYRLFNDLGSKGVAGEEGWTFYKPGIEYAVRPWGHPEDRPLQAIVEFKRQLKDRGIDLLVVVVPNKETVYPERLTPWASAHLSGKVGYGAMALDSLRQMGVSVVDLFSAFSQERRLDQNIEDAIYLEDDTHWRLRGLKRASLEVAQVVRKFAWYAEPHNSTSFVTKACRVDRDGDVLTMSKLRATIEFLPQTVKCEQILVAGPDSIAYQDDFRQARILILGDSFSRIYQTDAPRSAGWISHLAAELSEPLASLVSDGGASTLVREKLARKPGVLRGKRLVIWEFVERDFRYGDSGWKHVKLD